MNWREERRLLNACLAKHGQKKTGMGEVGIRAKRNERRKAKVESNRKWRKRNKSQYRAMLREAKAARARKQQESPSPRKARTLAQFNIIMRFFLCQK